MSANSDLPEFDVTVDDQGRVRFAHQSQARAYLRAKFAGQCIVAQFYEHRAKRSDRQSRGFHAMVRPWLDCESRGGWSIEALKFYALGETFGYLEYVHPGTGEVYRIPAEMHTSKLSVGQFCLLMERTAELAAEDGVVLVMPDEYRKAKEKAQRQAARAAQKGRAA